MTMTTEKTADALTVALEGRLDTTTAPQLQQLLGENLGDVKSLVLDFAKLDYLSSAGLRVLLSTQKTMNKQGSMTVRNVNETIMEIFEVTGFTELLHIE